MNDLLDTFLAEARELVEAAAADLLALERAPGDAARLDGLFRAVHTLKGSVGLFDLAPMGRALHAGEDLLEAVRAGRLPAGRAVIDALLEMVGAVEDWVEELAALGALPPAAEARGAALEAGLRGLLPGGGVLESVPDGGVGGAPVAAPASAGRAAPEWLEAMLARHAPVVAAAHAAGGALTALRYVPAEDCFFLGDDPMAVVRALPGLVALHLAPRLERPMEALEAFACNLVIEALVAAPEEAVRPVVRLVADQVRLVEVPAPVLAGVVLAGALAPAMVGPGAVPGDGVPAAGSAGGPAGGSAGGSAGVLAAGSAGTPAGTPAGAAPARVLRVEARRIDALVDLAGELVVAKNGLAHLVARAAGADPALARALEESRAGIERLAEAMHRGVLGLRMVPMGRAFGRLPRSAREIAGRLGKEVDFAVEGEAVEADKAIVDGLFEPLLHLLRNALDHGIEPPAAREAAGKPRAGRVVLRARRGGEGIVVELSDDGRGMDPARLRRLAVERGVMAAAEAAALDDARALGLVFLPGFSTAGQVTEVSGRGVGMDAVRAALEALGGRVSLSAAPGAGTTVRLALPRGAAVTTVLVVRAGGEAFGVPVEQVAETARVAAARIRPLQGAEAFVLRERTVPLLGLAGLLGLEPAPRGAFARVLVTGAAAGHAGLEVEGFAGRMDVLLRPLEGLLRGVPGMLGTALLGDGRVMMVLDVPELVGSELVGSALVGSELVGPGLVGRERVG